jgi:hypothetical protein
MGSLDIINNPAELYLTTDANATIRVYGWYVRILRKNINIITVDYTVPDATTLAKGIVRLAGDLSGTANNPTVPELANKVPNTRTVSTTSPLLGGGALSSDLTLSIQQANSVDSGFLSNVDWGRFDEAHKDRIVSAAVTGVAEKTLTLTQHDGGTITANWSDSDSDVTLGTANGLSLSGQVLSLGLAGASSTGALSSTDWNTFNNKQPLIAHLEFNNTNKTVWNNGNGNITSNTSFGMSALISNTTGNENTAFGMLALAYNTTGGDNTAFGWTALQSNTTGGSNSSFGWAALQSNTTGGSNSAFGVSTLESNTTGVSNTAFGGGALLDNTTGNNNTAVGGGALSKNITGDNNIALGISSGRLIADGTTANTITNNSIFLGSNTKALADNQTNQIVIGHNAIGAGSNTVTLGNTSITTTRLRGAVQGGSFVRDGGTSSQFLKADGSVDGTTYLPLAGGTLTGSLFGTNATFSQSTSENTLYGYNGKIAGTGVSAGAANGLAAYFTNNSTTYPVIRIIGLSNTNLIEGLNTSGTATFTVSSAGNVTANSFIKSGGTSSQFLKADGSVDSSTYATTSQLHNAVTLGTANGLSLSTQVLSLGLASSTSNGALSSTDWNTFNQKLSLSGGMLANSGAVSTLSIQHTSGSGIALIISKGGDGAALQVSKISGSGNAASITGGITLLSELNLTTKLADEHINSAATWNAKIGGSGTTNYLPKFTGVSTLGNSQIFDNGTNVGIGATSPTEKLSIGGVGSRIAFDTTGLAGANYIGTVEDFKLSLKATRGTTSEIKIGNENLEFFTNSLQRLTINTSGNVGIGTTSPSAKLDVNQTSAGAIVDNITVQNSSNTTATEAGIFFAPTTATGNIRGARITGIQEDGNNAIGLKFYTGLGATISERMRITSGGNVGIGTTSPAEILHLQSSQPVIRLTKTGVINWYAGNVTGNNYTIYPDSNNTSAFNITSSGNVGIGTISPIGRLHVVDAANFFVASFTGGGSANSLALGTAEGTPSIAGYSSGGASINVSINPYGGNVGIGTSNADARLRVSGTYNGTQAIFANVEGRGLEIATSLTAGTNEAGSVLNARGAGSGTMIFQTEGSERMRITSGGNVTIGDSSTSNTSKLNYASPGVGSFNGALELYHSTSNVSGSGFMNFYVNTSVIGSIGQLGTTAVVYNTTSDYRLKEDLKPIKGLEIVSKIKVYDYKWKSEDFRMDGVLAHELQEVVPYAVTGEKDGEQMQSVDYSKLVPILVQAIQELKAEIEILKTK